MRLLIKLVVVLVVLWCGWWALASYGISQALAQWADDRRADGWQVETQTSQTGFPMNLQTDVAALAVTNPETQATFRLNGARLQARTYWPGHVDLTLPQTPMTVETPDGIMALQTTNARTSLRLHPGLALELGSLRLTAKDWRVLADDTALITSEDFTLLADQDAQDDAKYSVTLAAKDLTPGALPRTLLSLPDDWPTMFEAFSAKGDVTFDGPLTRASLEETPPQLRGFTVQEADIIWGDLALGANGAVRVDADGMPTGQLDIQARNWRRLLDLAEGAGALPAKARGQAELMLGLLAKRRGRPEDMDLELVFKDGNMTLSGIPLGPAPRLLLRHYLQ